MERETKVRHAQDEADLQWMYKIQQEEYGADSIVSFDNVKAWWTRFPQGTFRMIHEGELIGGMGIWPLQEAIFSALTSGKLDEHQMEATHIEPKRDGQRYSYWYVGDILLQKNYRLSKEKWAVRLLIEVLDAWIKSGNLASQIKLCALVYSHQGRSLAERLQFHECAKTPDGYAVYVRDTTVEEMQKDLVQMAGLFKYSL